MPRVRVCVRARLAAAHGTPGPLAGCALASDALAGGSVSNGPRSGVSEVSGQVCVRRLSRLIPPASPDTASGDACFELTSTSVGQQRRPLTRCHAEAGARAVGVTVMDAHDRHKAPGGSHGGSVFSRAKHEYWFLVHLGCWTIFRIPIPATLSGMPRFVRKRSDALQTIPNCMRTSPHSEEAGDAPVVPDRVLNGDQRPPCPVTQPNRRLDRSPGLRRNDESEAGGTSGHTVWCRAVAAAPGVASSGASPAGLLQVHAPRISSDHSATVHAAAASMAHNHKYTN